MKAAGLALINCTKIFTQCSVTRENLHGHPLFGYNTIPPKNCSHKNKKIAFDFFLYMWTSHFR